ncbi:rhodanese-like domain-containing protein [Paraclostridium bifermentans]|uniref:rhodanese-like domain-containing protein n=1 Tax=Paraclostridium bifermentans TaxID=1490 RepID=UPI00359C23D3
MNLLFKKYLIDFKDISNEVTIDVRTKEEYLKNGRLDYNIEIITKREHEFLHKHLFWAEVVILYGMIKNLKYIKSQLINLSVNKERPVVIGCSKGRLRSPTMWIYAKMLGIDAKVLRGGIISIKI